MGGVLGAIAFVDEITMETDTRPAIIFDFDGTLADSLYATLSTLYHLIHREPLPMEDISQLRGMTMIQVLHKLKVPLWRALFLKESVHNEMRDRMDDIALIPGMDELVRALAKDYRLFVASSNDVANVQIFLQRFNIKSSFEGVYGDANPMFKARVLRRIIRDNHLVPKRTWYVGDQAWDISAAHRAGMRAAAVAWGFSNLHVLKTRKPDALAFSPDELARALTATVDHA